MAAPHDVAGTATDGSFKKNAQYAKRAVDIVE
jgi:hypothetical protein